jgi:type VI secretion system protein ImpL
MFAPAYATSSVFDPDQRVLLPASVLPTWQFLAAAARNRRGKHIGFYWPNAIAAVVAVATMAWCVALLISFIGN